MSTNTVKLELPSISQVHTRGPVDVSWYNHHSAQRSLLSSDRLPDLHLPQAQAYPASTSSGTSSSRIGSLDSSTYNGNQYPPSQTSASTYQPSSGLKSPSPPAASHNLAPQSHGLADVAAHHSEYPTQQHPEHAYTQEHESYSSAMNPSQQYMDSHQSHMSTGQSYTPQSATAGGMSHYPQYQQQPPVLQPGPGSYAPSPSSYGQYGYSNGVTSPQSGGQPVSAPMGGQMNSQLLPLPGRKFESISDRKLD